MRGTITRRILVFVLVTASFALDARADYLLFDSATDSVQIDGQTPVGGSFTYEAVVVFTPYHNGAGDVFVEWTGGQEHKLLGIGPDIAAGFNYPRGGSHFNVTGFHLSMYQPHHIAYVSERYEERMYVDGQLVGSRATSTAVVDAGSNGGFLGGGAFGAGWMGYLDSIRISDCIRYTGTSFTPTLDDLTSDENTLLLYNFNELAGSSTVADLSGNDRTGTLGVGLISGTTSPEFVSEIPGPPALSMSNHDAHGLVVSNLTVGTTNWLESTSSLPSGSWTTIAIWTATGTQTNLSINKTNETGYFRLRAKP